MLNFNINLKTLNGESLIGTSNISIPVITLTSQLTNDSGYITSSALTGFATESWVEAKNYLTSASLTGYATEAWVTAQNYLTSADLSLYALKTELPTKTSDLTNDSGFITSSALSNYYTKSEVNSIEDNLELQIMAVNEDLTDLDNSLSTVAKTGDYNDLLNRPTIPQQHYRGTFVSLVALESAIPTANAGDYAIVDVVSEDAELYVWDNTDSEWIKSGSTTAPTTTDALPEGSINLYFTNARAVAAQVQPDWNATSGKGEILNKPTIPSLTGYATETYVDDAIEDLDNSLSTVAKTGDYNDLTSKPTIPAEQVNSDWNATSGKAEILNKPDLSIYATETYVDDEINALDIPTLTSDLTNDSGFITSSALSPYSNTTQMNTAISDKTDKVDIMNISFSTLSLTINDHYGKFLVCTNETDITIPTNASQAFPIGTKIEGFCNNASAPNMSFTASGGVTLIAKNGNKINNKTAFSLIKIATNTWILIGDTTV